MLTNSIYIYIYWDNKTLDDELMDSKSQKLVALSFDNQVVLLAKTKYSIYTPSFSIKRSKLYQINYKWTDSPLTW